MSAIGTIRKRLSMAAKSAACLMPRSHRLVSMLGPAGLRVVLYHDVSPMTSPLTNELALTTPPETLEAHLRAFAHDYDVVDLDTVLSGRWPRRPLLITFDDAYRSVTEIAVPMLRERSMPGVFFITAGGVGASRLILDNLLCYLVNTVGLARLEHAITPRPPRCRSLRELISDVVAEMSYALRSELSDRLTAEFSVDHEAILQEFHPYIGAEDVRSLPARGIEVGNHTWSHIHCRSLDARSSRLEITEAKAELERLAGRPVRAMSFPYGDRRDMTPGVQAIIRQSQHDAMFLVHGCANAHRVADDVWHRVSLQRQTDRQLFAELEMMPRIRSLRDALHTT